MALCRLGQMSKIIYFHLSGLEPLNLTFITMCRPSVMEGIIREREELIKPAGRGADGEI